jgi:hypothetical protein
LAPGCRLGRHNQSVRGWCGCTGWRCKVQQWQLTPILIKMFSVECKNGDWRNGQPLKSQPLNEDIIKSTRAYKTLRNRNLQEMYRFRSKLLTFGQIHTSLNKQAHTEDDILSMDSSWWLFLNKLIIVKMGVNDMVKAISDIAEKHLNSLHLANAAITNLKIKFECEIS